jgi:hypothetical protein
MRHDFFKKPRSQWADNGKMYFAEEWGEGVEQLKLAQGAELCEPQW